MFCPNARCQKGRSKVIDKTNYHDRIYRRRQCLACGCRFSTHEVIIKTK
jgi:transcriptional regulator NrdR family protein